MAQTVTSNIRTALIEGADTNKAINYAHDFSDLLGNVKNVGGFFQTLENNLTPLGGTGMLEIKKGVAFVKYNKASGEVGFLKFSLGSDVEIDLSTESDGDYYAFIELDSSKVDNGSGEVDGSDVANIKVDSALPSSGDYLEVCSLNKSGTTITVTDKRKQVEMSLGKTEIEEVEMPAGKIGEFGIEVASDSLDVTVRGGVYKEDGSTASDVTLTLSVSSTNYVELNPSSGVISANTTGFSGVALWEVVTDGMGAVSVIDKRQALIGSAGGMEIATQADAESGIDNIKAMTPLRTKQAWEIFENKFVGVSNEAIDGSVTPQALSVGYTLGTSENKISQTSEDDEISAYDTGWSIQTFTPTGDWLLDTITLKCREYGDASAIGDLIIEIYKWDDTAENTTGNALGSVSISATTLNSGFTEEIFDFSSQNIFLENGKKYCFIMRCTAGSSDDRVVFRYYNDYPSDPYSGGTLGYSGDNGTSWTFNDWDNLYFKIKAASYTSEKVQKAQAGTLPLEKFVGMTKDNVAADANVNVQYAGVVDGFSGLAAGKDYYVDTNAGGVSTAGSVKVGRAISATEILIKN